ncbi:MAG: GIY-YIG nuclease family protein [Candidatus Paceibacterota bacterium]
MAWSQAASSWPSGPGVYSFFAANDKILYVGKAKNLKNRLSSYTQYNQLAPRIKKLVTDAVKVEFKVLDSELEALLIEAELIRTHQPFFNIRLKDDKSPIYLVITDEDFPRVIKKRKTDLIKEKPRGTILGPFPSSSKLNEVLKIARKIFPWCNDPAGNRACFYYHLDLCPGACTGEISATAYRENIQELILFMRGKKRAIVKDLIAKMKQASDQQAFEKAQIYKQKILLIEEVTHKQYRLAPNLVLPGFNLEQAQQGLIELQKILQTYTNFPRTAKLSRIEGYDVSNIQGTSAAVGMVVFTDGQIDKQQYRLFNIYTLNTPNDYQMMQEALQRRQNHAEWTKPNLVVIDGGKGQVRAALKVWQWDSPVIGIAKNPDRLIVPTKQEGRHIDYEVLKLPATHPALKLVQQIRDESHRFAKKQFQRRYAKKLLG